jgi:hypothetical protein
MSNILKHAEKELQCFECETGTYKDITVNYFSQLSLDRSCVTKDVTIQRCDTCDAEIIDSKASQIIESNIERNFPGYYDKWKTKNKSRL